MRGHCLPCPKMMNEGFLDISRPLCYFPDFSYKANTFIFYAKVIQRIYRKVGGWLSWELPVQRLPQGPLLGPSSSPEGPAGRQRVTAASLCPPFPECPVSGALGLALAPPHPSLGVLETGGSRSRRKLPVLKHISLFILFFLFFFLRERSLQGPFQTKRGPKCHHHSRDWSFYKY
ncbi:unnamed protein product [Pipistrellus nathusii]|uniref:Uncharacterized protein n=1 Tax=Pipistrellus nathusii TaxID=59473 RepID=A0ABP0A4T7_PIPNA